MPQSTPTFDLFARSIAADRNFDAAATGYIETFVSWRRALAGFNKVISSNARRRIMRSILSLHFGNVTENPDDGATFERLLSRSNPGADESLDGCGPRVLRTVISLAQRSGHLTVSQGWYDRRLKILRPTDKWISEEADRHEVALASLGMLMHDRSHFAARPRGAALVGRLAVIAGRNESAVGVSLGEPDAPMRAVVALDGGLATAFAVGDAWIRGKRLPSHKEIGASFRLSASQARKILRLAARPWTRRVRPRRQDRRRLGACERLPQPGRPRIRDLPALRRPLRNRGGADAGPCISARRPSGRARALTAVPPVCANGAPRSPRAARHSILETGCRFVRSPPLRS